MTLAPSYPMPIPFAAVGALSRPAARLLPQPAPALSTESATVVVRELVELARRLDLHAQHEGARVSADSLVAKAFLVAALRHPGVEARWPRLPDRHGLSLRELTDALESAESAAPVPHRAAVLSVGVITHAASDETLSVSLAFDARHTDAVAAHRLLEEFASLLAEPWELVAHV